MNPVNWREPVSDHGKVTLPFHLSAVRRRQKEEEEKRNYGRQCRTRELQKNHSECISYEHVMRSVIQNPKALSSKKLERGGDGVRECVLSQKRGRYRLISVHIWVHRCASENCSAAHPKNAQPIILLFL